MKTKATLVTAILVVIAAVGTTTYVVNHRDAETQGKAPGADPSKLAAPTEGRERKARERTPQFQSIEEAEQALIDFDLTPIFGSDREEANRCSFRLRIMFGSIKNNAAFFGRLMQILRLHDAATGVF